MLRKLTLLLISTVAFSQTTEVAPKQPPKPYDVPEAFEVYAAVLALHPPEGELIISEDTVPFNGCQDPRPDKVVGPAIADYKKTNKAAWYLRKGSGFGRDYKLLSAGEIEALKKPDPRGDFFWRFPDGIWLTRFSAVGFNKNKTIAFVAMDGSCGSLCGHGTSYTLQKVDGKWREYERPGKTKVVKSWKDANGDYHYRIVGRVFGSSCAWAH